MINYLKDRYYWYSINQKLKYFLEGKKEQKILMYGYPKSGNTWLRFLIYNYCSLLLNPNEVETISYNRLNILQNNIMDRGTTFLHDKGFPLFYRTHKIHNKTYNLFDKKVFVHRNPLDTLISSYYFYKNRELPFSDYSKNIRYKLHDIDFYVAYKIDAWVKFYNTSIKYSDFTINYSEMRKDTETILIKLLRFFDWDINQELLRRSIDLSSFKNVRKMGQEKKQQYGNGPRDGEFKGEFTRSGKEAQFKYELKEVTINFVLEKFPEFNNLYPDLVE